MDLAISNMNFLTPTSTSAIHSSSSLRCPSLLTMKCKVLPHKIKAMAGETRNNLDHLQRANQQQQLHRRARQDTAAPASPVLWDRFPSAKTVQQMMDTMERMMEDPFVFNKNSPSLVVRELDDYGKGNIPWAIKEEEETYRMRFNMPGMNKNDVKIWVEDNMLVVKAEKVSKEHHEGNAGSGGGEMEGWPAKSFGKYSHRIALPDNIEFDKIQANVKDGILFITVPKARVSSKIVEINVQ